MQINGMKKAVGAAVFGVGMLASAGSYAGSILNPVVAGLATGYEVTAPGVLSSQGPGVVIGPAALLAGDATAPGGNIELGKFGSSPATTLSGTIGGKAITLSGLTIDDWQADGSALANRFISDAASSVGVDLGLIPGALDAIRNNFFGLNAWMLVSDPNISYVNNDKTTVEIGLAGFFNATPVLQTLFGGLVAINPTDVLQVSEVVKVNYDGGADKYLYGFIATDSGQMTDDGTASHTGNYEVHVPVPATLALLLVGAAAGMKRRAAKA